MGLKSAGTGPSVDFYLATQPPPPCTRWFTCQHCGQLFVALLTNLLSVSVPEERDAALHHEANCANNPERTKPGSSSTR